MRLRTPDLHRSRRTLAAAAFVGALAICWSWPGYKQIQADTYLLLYWGRWIAAHGIPHREVFTVAAAGRPLADQQWLAGLIDYEAWKVAGYNGLALLTALLFGSGFALLAALMRSRGASVILAVSCATLALFGTISLTFIRAQIFAVPLFIALLWLCLADAEQAGVQWRVVLTLPLLALWANLHGSVLIGVALASPYFAYRALCLVSRGARRGAAAYAVLAPAAVLMGFATPYGTHVLTYYGSMLGNRAIGLADIEWDSPAFPTFAFFQFAIPLLLACAGVLAVIAKRRRPPSLPIGAVAITAVAAAIAMHNNIWLAITAAVLVAETASAWVPTQATSRGFLAGLFAASFALVALGVAPLLTRSGAGFESDTPRLALAATASYSSAHPCARILADNASASALLWLYPGMAGRVGFDGELEAYPQAALASWVAFRNADNPRWLLAARGYQILVGATIYQPALVRRLGRLTGAAVLAHDPRGIAVLDLRARAYASCKTPLERAPVIASRSILARGHEISDG